MYRRRSVVSGYLCRLGSETLRAACHTSRRRLVRGPADPSRRTGFPMTHVRRTSAEKARENFFFNITDHFSGRVLPSVL